LLVIHRISQAATKFVKAVIAKVRHRVGVCSNSTYAKSVTMILQAVSQT
jgi:hypothetical protein